MVSRAIWWQSSRVAPRITRQRRARERCAILVMRLLRLSVPFRVSQSPSRGRQPSCLHSARWGLTSWTQSALVVAEFLLIYIFQSVAPADAFAMVPTHSRDVLQCPTRERSVSTDRESGMVRDIFRVTDRDGMPLEEADFQAVRTQARRSVRNGCARTLALRSECRNSRGGRQRARSGAFRVLSWHRLHCVIEWRAPASRCRSGSTSSPACRLLTRRVGQRTSSPRPR